MRILITGGTGFIGQALCPAFLAQGHELTVLSRHPHSVPERYGSAVQGIADLDQIPASTHFDAIINLAGEGIADARWTKKRQQILRDSRIGITDQIIDYIERATQQPNVLISGSAIGFYGDQGDRVLNEKATPVADFAQTLCADWETSALRAESSGVRVCLVRTGLVIGENGGFLKRMVLPFKLGLGGQIGDGQQWMSWIHRDDFISIIQHLLDRTDLSGAFNATAPQPVTNQTLTRSLAACFGRKPFLPVPAFVLKLALGEMSSLLLGGQRVIPQRLLDDGFRFQFDTLDNALTDVLVEKPAT